MTDRAEVFDKPLTYEEVVDGETRVVYRGSGLGSCVGALVRSRMGITASMPSDFMLGKFQEGIDWEQRVIEMAAERTGCVMLEDAALGQYGEVVDGQVEVEIPVGKSAVIKLHPDAVFRDVSGKVYVVEVKFLSEAFAKTKTDEDFGELYEWQFAAEILGTGLPGLYVIATKQIEEVDGEKVVTGIADMRIIRRDEPKMTLMDLKSRIWEVEGYVARGEIPGCPLPLMYPCGYWAEHEKAEVVKEDDEVLVGLIGTYKVHDQFKRASEKMMSEARDQIIARMVELDRKLSVVEGVAKVSWVDARAGNVSWKNAYEKLAKQVGKKLIKDELDELRGKEMASGIKVEIDKGE